MGDVPAQDFPAVGAGGGPPDAGGLPGQDWGYEEAENLEPDTSLADPAVLQ